MSLCTEIYCDGCGVGLRYSGCIGKTHIQRWARKDGWSIGKYDLCPDCKKNRKQLKKDGWIY